jgi:hypothetical protein
MQVNSSSSAFNIGVQGIQDAQSRLNKAAQGIASQSVTDSTKDSISTQSLTSSLVDLKVAENDALANAKVVETASDVLGTLLDITA